MLLRREINSDILAIGSLIGSAFQDARHANGTEAEIVDALRRGEALALSLVAIEEREVIGYVAFSPVSIGGQSLNWFGLGPVAVKRDFRRRGIGAALIKAGLHDLDARDAGGCVVLANPPTADASGSRSIQTSFLPASLPPTFSRCTCEGTIP